MQYPGFEPRQQPDGSVVMVPIGGPPPQPTYGQQPQNYGAPPPQPGAYPGYPPQQPQYAPPPQNYGAPPPGAYPGYPPQQPQYAPPGPPMPPAAPTYPAGPMIAPQVYLPTQDEFAALYARAQEQQAAVLAARAGQSGGKFRELRFLGPNGEKNWDTVPVGYEAQRIFRILPSGIQGLNYFFEGPKHFFFTPDRPNGTGGWCPVQGCQLCEAIKAGAGSLDAQVQKRAAGARARTHRLYQGLSYGDVQAHRDENGRIRPLPYDAPFDVHSGIMALINERGPITFLDLQRGAPFRIIKKKVGAYKQNVDYRVVDLLQMAGPIPPEFGFGPNGEGLELLDLRKVAKPMDVAFQQKAIAALGLPPPGGQVYSYAPNPPAPGPSPYGQQPPSYNPPPSQQPPSYGPPQQSQYASPPQLPAVAPPGSQPPTPPGWTGPSTPPVLPSTGQPPPSSYQAPRDPWADQQPPQTQAVQQPPPPPPVAQGWGAPPPQAPPPPAPSAATQSHLQQLQAQLGGPGPAFPPPPVSAPPPR